MLVLTVKLVALTLSVTWGLTKTILFGVGLPVILAALFIAGLTAFAVPLLILALLIGFVVCAFIRKSVHKHHLDVELEEAKAAAEAETAAAAENTAPVQEGNDEQTH